MYYGQTNLKAALKRDVIIDGEYSLEMSYAEIKGFTHTKVKAGVFLLTSSSTISSRNIIHTIYHPSLYQYGEVSAPSVVGPGVFKLHVGFRPFGPDFDLDSLDYFARIFIESSILGRGKK